MKTKFRITLLFIFLNLFLGRLFATDSLLFIIRVDDVLSRNTAVQPRSIVPFQQSVESRGGKVTWAVIPHRLVEQQNADGKLAGELQESVLQGHEVIQHGYIHICSLCGKYHEFYCPTYNQGFSYEEQENWIALGKKILQDSVGITPLGFVPPGHQADSVTFRVLADQGFNSISTTAPDRQELTKGLFNIEPSGDYTWNLKSDQYKTQLDKALRDIKQTIESRGVFCLLFHDYFTRQGYESGLVIRWVAELMDSLNNFYGDRLNYVTLSEARGRLVKPSAIAKIEGSSVQTFYLAQNFPNPFNAQTVIRYKLFNPARVRINFFDLRGRLIDFYDLGLKESGNFSFRWFPAGISSGTYLYQMEVHSINGQIFKDRKRCLFLK
ncbi:MAG: DUF2334 domain-containing protein [Calditrichaeota bacterium]|nr:DUF2334 domain-containing protein [Calditrichota bacterium]